MLLSKAREGAEPGVKPRALVLFVGGDTLGALSQLLQGVSSVRPLALDLLWQVHFIASHRSSHTTCVLLCTCCGKCIRDLPAETCVNTCQEHALFKCQVLHVSRQQEQLGVGARPAAQAGLRLFCMLCHIAKRLSPPEKSQKAASESPCVFQPQILERGQQISESSGSKSKWRLVRMAICDMQEKVSQHLC